MSMLGLEVKIHRRDIYSWYLPKSPLPTNRRRIHRAWALKLALKVEKLAASGPALARIQAQSQTIKSKATHSRNFLQLKQLHILPASWKLCKSELQNANSVFKLSA